MPFLPDVLELGPFPLGMDAVAAVLGGVLAFLLAGWSARRRQADAEAAQDIVLNLMLGGTLTAKLFYVLLDPGSYLDNPTTLLLFPYGPMSMPLGALGGAVAVAWGLRSRADRLAVLDAAVLPLLAGMTVGAAGWKEPGSWAFAPALALAAGVAWLGGGRLTQAAAGNAEPACSPGTAPGAPFPGLHAAHTAVLAATALTVADLARPVAGLAAGVTLLQIAAVLAGTTAWLWARGAH